MKKIQSTLLASSLIASLFFSTAYAATSATEDNPHKMRELVAAYQAENPSNLEGNRMANIKEHRGVMMRRNGAHWKLLSELTGKDVATIQQECNTKKITPYAYAKENGVEVQFQAKQLAAVKSALSRAVANNKVSQEKADAALTRFLNYQKDETAGKVMYRAHGPLMMDKGQNCMPQGERGYRRPDSLIAKGLMPFDTLASLTGKSVVELESTCRDGQKTPYDIARESNVLDQYKENRIAANKEILNKLVANGKVTQEKADIMLAKVEKNISENKPEREHHFKGFMEYGPNRGQRVE